VTRPATRPGNATGVGPIITRFSAIKAEPVIWLWPRYLPAGMLSVIDGDPGLGKSTLTNDLAARVSTGRGMPDGSGGGLPAGVVLLSAEDDLARTIRPRLEAAGADLDRVATLALHDHDGGTRAPLISRTDLVLVEEAIVSAGAALLVFDPLVAYLPDGIDTNRDHDVRRALTALSDLASRTHCATLVVRHLRKGGAENPLYRGGGSIGITAAARAVFLVAKDPDDPGGDRRVFAPIKTNLALPPPSLAFRFVADPGRPHPRLAWEGVSAHDARALLDMSSAGDDRSAVDEAQDVLRAILADGPLRAQEAQRQAHEAGISHRTLDRARRALGITAHKSGRPGDPDQHWEWALPLKDANGERRTPTQERGVLRPVVAPLGGGEELESDADEGASGEADYPSSAYGIELGVGVAPIAPDDLWRAFPPGGQTS
jgi:AAA domain